MASRDPNPGLKPGLRSLRFCSLEKKAGCGVGVDVDEDDASGAFVVVAAVMVEAMEAVAAMVVVAECMRGVRRGIGASKLQKLCPMSHFFSLSLLLSTFGEQRKYRIVNPERILQVDERTSRCSGGEERRGRERGREREGRKRGDKRRVGEKVFSSVQFMLIS